MAGDDLVETKKGSSKNSKDSNESKLKQKSPAEFFAENKNIAGFDNVSPQFVGFNSNDASL
jgi:hypothetical protein